MDHELPPKGWYPNPDPGASDNRLRYWDGGRWHHEFAEPGGGGISGLWYVAAVVLPIVGIVAGIVFMAQSKIGPALALWATSAVAAAVYAAIML